MENAQLLKIEIDDQKYNDALEALYARAFGPARFTKAAHFLRQGNVCAFNLSRVAFLESDEGKHLVGACRIWPIYDENNHKAWFLGPIAVESDNRHLRIGKKMVDECIEAIEKIEDLPIVLVGDFSYFGQFGFEEMPRNSIILPLPAAHGRILWRKSKSRENIFAGCVFGAPQK